MRHPTKHLRLFLASLVAAGWLAVALSLTMSAAFAQGPARDLTAQSANIYAGGGGSLSAASGAGMAATVADFLATKGHGAETLASLVLTATHVSPTSGVTHLKFGQAVAGLGVYGTYVKAAFDGDGDLIHLIENLAELSGRGVVAAAAAPRDALNEAMLRNHPGVIVGLVEGNRSGNVVSFSGGGFFHRDPTVTRVAIAMENGPMAAGFLVETWTNRGNMLHHTLVGGAGGVLGVELRTNNDSYWIFPDHPGMTDQALAFGPGAGNLQSPLGWLFANGQTTVDIAGNNANAYLDTDANNSSDGGGLSVTDGVFDATADLADDPENGNNPAVAVQNLFYLNNVLHDKLYRHGFTETAGNFQEDNFSKGGNGSDSVNAEAQDGSGLNNANFSTPSDGSNPRMQMFLWTQSIPRRDGDVDSDIVYHEYGHGLTWRMIGNMGGSMSGAIGEGMSDVLAILINDNDVLAEYSFNNTTGIRSASYTGYGRTYGDMGGSSVHFDGEIYAATIWRLWELFQDNAIDQDKLFDYLIDGMNSTPAGPAMEDMRDGILQAAAGSGHECIIWQAFADFGIGEGASGRIQGGGPFGGGRVRITESFDLPAVCSGPVAPVASDDSYSVVKDTDLTVSAPGVLDNDSDANGDAITAILLSNPSNGVLVGGLNPGGSFTYRPDPEYEGFDSFTYDASDGGMSDTATVNITVTGGGEPPPPGSTMHIGDLDVTELANGGSTWSTTVEITVHDSFDNPLANATVSVGWSGSGPGDPGCTTDGSGQCGFLHSGIHGKKTTLTVNNITHLSLTYDSGANDVGTAITVQKP